MNVDDLYGLAFAYWADMILRGPVVFYGASLIDNPFWYFRGVIPRKKESEPTPEEIREMERVTYAGKAIM